MTVRFPRPMGSLSARVHGARKALDNLPTAARAASTDASLDERAAAALRGKAVAYDEAAQLLAAIDNGTRLPRKAVESR